MTRGVKYSAMFLLALKILRFYGKHCKVADQTAFCGLSFLSGWSLRRSLVSVRFYLYCVLWGAFFVLIVSRSVVLVSFLPRALSFCIVCA